MTLGAFSDRTIIVTGAASGIGRAAALALAERGATVVVADLAAAGEAVAAEIEEKGGKALFVRTDVTDSASVAALVEHAAKHCGRIHGAINNAGRLARPGDTAEVDEDDWHKVMAVNLHGVMYCLKWELRHMAEQGGGAIVNLLSGASLAAFPGYPAYTASKHGALGVTRSAALEYARKGIRINAICPGLVRTPMKDELIQGDRDVEASFESSFPMGRMAEPEEIAATALWLLSDASSYVNGAAIAVDGGVSARS